MKNSIKVGEKTILFLPSSQCLTKSQQNASQIKFDVVQRTNLGTLCESKLVLKLIFCQLPSLPSLLICLQYWNFPWDIRRMYAKLAFVWYFPPSVAPLPKSWKKVFFFISIYYSYSFDCLFLHRTSLNLSKYFFKRRLHTVTSNRYVKYHQ